MQFKFCNVGISVNIYLFFMYPAYHLCCMLVITSSLTSLIMVVIFCRLCSCSVNNVIKFKGDKIVCLNFAEVICPIYISFQPSVYLVHDRERDGTPICLFALPCNSNVMKPGACTHSTNFYLLNSKKKIPLIRLKMVASWTSTAFLVSSIDLQIFILNQCSETLVFSPPTNSPENYNRSNSKWLQLGLLFVFRVSMIEVLASYTINKKNVAKGCIQVSVSTHMVTDNTQFP